MPGVTIIAKHVSIGEIMMLPCSVKVHMKVFSTTELCILLSYQNRISQSLETCIERLDEECIAYDKAASSEEERTSLLSNILSMNADTGGLDDIHGEEDEDDAILR